MIRKTNLDTNKKIKSKLTSYLTKENIVRPQTTVILPNTCFKSMQEYWNLLLIQIDLS